MPRKQAGRLPLHGASSGGRRLLLGARPGPCREAPEDSQQGWAGQRGRGAARPEKAAEGPRRRRPGRQDGDGQGRRGEPDTEHHNPGHRAGEEELRDRGARGAPRGDGRSAKREESRMSKNGLHRHYDKLSPEERFRLDVLAMARGDEQESERLVRSCPRATYTTNDRAFTGRWSGAENIALRISLPLLQELGRLRVVDAMRVLAPYQGTLNENLAFDAYHKG